MTTNYQKIFNFGRNKIFKIKKNVLLKSGPKINTIRLTIKMNVIKQEDPLMKNSK